MGRVIVITGPTATGKTALSVEAALRFDCEIVSADSMQVYRYMDIGTAKITAEEMRGVPHYMLDCVSPFEDYSVSRYVREASECVDDILRRGKTPLIVGGTGLYIDSLISGTEFAERPDTSLRSELSDMYDQLGGEAMLRKLAEFDPESAQKLHAADKKRIVRAFEIFRLSGETATEHDERTKKLPPRYDAVKIALTFSDRGRLYERIDRRVDIMLERGLVREVRSLIDMGVPESSTAMQAIGYKELSAYFRGECSLDGAADSIKQGSRRYAKRQLSWLRRDSRIKWIYWDNEPDISSALRVFDGIFGKI